MSEPWLVLETSGRIGQVGLADGSAPIQARSLDPTRRHNRDLVPAIRELLQASSLEVKNLAGVMVSHGPGSFTGLRVGVMTAKMLAFASGCGLVAVSTFQAIAEQCGDQAERVDVIADALKGNVYGQRFRRNADGDMEPEEELRIESMVDRMRVYQGGWISGPGVDLFDAAIGSDIPRPAKELRLPTLEAVFRLGSRVNPLSVEQVMRLEPLYARLSSAEEKAATTAPQ